MSDVRSAIKDAISGWFNLVKYDGTSLSPHLEETPPETNPTWMYLDEAKIRKVNDMFNQ